MATRRVIKCVLGNFLGTYTSRYSDFGGYWLFGFLVADLAELQINLLGQDVSDPASPSGVAISSAVAKFDEQREKSQRPRAKRKPRENRNYGSKSDRAPRTVPQRNDEPSSDG